MARPNGKVLALQPFIGSEGFIVIVDETATTVRDLAYQIRVFDGFIPSCDKAPQLVAVGVDGHFAFLVTEHPAADIFAELGHFRRTETQTREDIIGIDGDITTLDADVLDVNLGHTRREGEILVERVLHSVNGRRRIEWGVM